MLHCIVTQLDSGRWMLIIHNQIIVRATSHNFPISKQKKLDSRFSATTQTEIRLMKYLRKQVVSEKYVPSSGSFAGTGWTVLGLWEWENERPENRSSCEWWCLRKKWWIVVQFCHREVPDGNGRARVSSPWVGWVLLGNAEKKSAARRYIKSDMLWVGLGWFSGGSGFTEGYCAALSSRMAAQKWYESLPGHGAVVQFYIRWLIGKSWLRVWWYGSLSMWVMILDPSFSAWSVNGTIIIWSR